MSQFPRLIFQFKHFHSLLHTHLLLLSTFDDDAVDDDRGSRWWWLRASADVRLENWVDRPRRPQNECKTVPKDVELLLSGSRGRDSGTICVEEEQRPDMGVEGGSSRTTVKWTVQGFFCILTHSTTTLLLLYSSYSRWIALDHLSRDFPLVREEGSPFQI